jgi:sec-independent protein translocase protein TatA
MPSWIGPWEIAIVLVLALLIFGPRKLPDLGASLGKSIRGFKQGLKETEEEVTTAVAEVREGTDALAAEPQATPAAEAAPIATAAAVSTAEAVAPSAEAVPAVAEAVAAPAAEAVQAPETVSSVAGAEAPVAEAPVVEAVVAEAAPAQTEKAE